MRAQYRIAEIVFYESEALLDNDYDIYAITDDIEYNKHNSESFVFTTYIAQN